MGQETPFNASGIGIIAVIVATISAIAIVISIINYSRRLKKALENEKKTDFTAEEYKSNSQAHTAFPSPSATSGFVYKLVILLLLIYCCIVTSQISQLKAEHAEIKTAIQEGKWQISNQLSDLRSELIEVIDNQDNLVSSLKAEASNFNLEKNSCDLVFSLALKEAPAAADVSLTLSDNTTVKLERLSSGVYSGSTSAALFNSNLEDDIVINISSDTLNKTEQATLEDLYLGYLYECALPIFTPCLITGESETGMTLSTDFKINLNTSYYTEYITNQIKSSEIIYYVSGEEYQREDITEKLKNLAFEYADITPLTLEKLDPEETVTISVITTLTDGYTLEESFTSSNSDGECHIKLFSPDGTLLYNL